MSVSTLSPVVLPDGYQYIAIMVVIIGFQLLLTGFSAGLQRGKYFTKEYMEKNFPELKNSVEKGYPDTGSGVFASKLPLQDWINFNNYQRAHMNYLEGIFPFISAALVSGLVYTRLSFLCCVVYVIGRQVYAYGYCNFGSKGRIIGALVLDAALLILVVASFMAVAKYSNWDHFMNFVFSK